MKKSIFALVLVVIATIFFAPGVDASDRDVGYQFNLPVDNAAVVAIDQAGINTFHCVIPIVLRDPGDMPVELSARSTGLREESTDLNTIPFPNVDLTDNTSFRDRQSTRIKDMNSRYNVTQAVLSTSNGGAGY